MDKKSLFEGRLKEAVKDKVFPGCVLGVVFKNGKRIVCPIGTFTYKKDSARVGENAIYDIASITKAVPGSAVLLKLIDEGKLNTNDKLVDYLPEFGNHENKKNVSIKHILTYTLDLDLPSMSSLKNKTAGEIVDCIMYAPLKNPPNIKYLYTNSTAFFIGLVAEKITGKKLDELADEYFFKPLGMGKTTFHPERFDKSEIAPTEMDEWRGRVVHGEVHDESTYTLMKEHITPIAGLFSTVPDMLTFQKMLLNDGSYEGKRYYSPAIVRQMHTNQISDIGEYAGLGWELNKPTYMGKYSNEHMMGKTGFTGCVMITDPIKEVGFTLLSNRIYPKRPKDNNAINEVRRDIADMVFTDL